MFRGVSTVYTLWALADMPAYRRNTHSYAFEAMSLGAGYLGELSQAANAIAVTMGSLCWQLPLAISQSSSIRVGHHIGSNQPDKARKAAQAAQILAIFITGLGAIGLTLGRHLFGQAFAVDPAVSLLFDRMVCSPPHCVR